MQEIIDNIHIVLVGTTHPGNIGAAARAMKTMGHSSLRLVSPKIYPSAEATARATGADDILSLAKVYSDLKQAIADCELVLGTTARERSIPWPMVTPRQCAETIFNNSYSSVAIVFGRESSGLSNEELELCNMMLKIPSNAEYGSLNLASAVQIICYEIFLLASITKNKITNKTPLVDQQQMELFYAHLEECMLSLDFLDPENPGKLMHRMRRLFNRAQLDEDEYNILRGLLSSMESKQD